MEEYSFQKGYSMIDSWTFAVNLEDMSLRLNECYSLSDVKKSGRCIKFVNRESHLTGSTMVFY